MGQQKVGWCLIHNTFLTNRNRINSIWKNKSLYFNFSKINVLIGTPQKFSVFRANTAIAQNSSEYDYNCTKHIACFAKVKLGLPFFHTKIDIHFAVKGAEFINVDGPVGPL